MAEELANTVKAAGGAPRVFINDCRVLRAIMLI
jgi:hypothetical protein